MCAGRLGQETYRPGRSNRAADGADPFASGNRRDRPADVYIALYGNGQACDKGVVIADPDSAESADLTIGDSLAPEALFERYHQAYAAWLAKDRQLLSVNLNLSVIELASFRMWQAVRVRSRNFLVSKLTVRVAASADGVNVNADLISL